MSIYEDGKIKVRSFTYAFVSIFFIVFVLMISTLLIEIISRLYLMAIDGSLIKTITDVVFTIVFVKIVFGFLILWTVFFLIAKNESLITSFFSRFDLVCKRIEPSENIKKISSDIENLSTEEQKQIQIIIPALLRKLETK